MADDKRAEKTKQLLIEALRRSPATADDLARRFDLTTNAVRFHLASLEADRSIEPAGIRKPPGAGKPAVLYRLTDEADLGFSKAYAPVLAACIHELRSSIPQDELIPLLHRVGRRVAVPGDKSKPLSQRVRAASDALNALGALTTVVKTSDGFEIRGIGCPLAAVVTAESCACTVIESLLAKLVGARVREHCDRSERPSCCFKISAA